MRTKQLSLRLSDQDREALRARAAREGRTVSALLRDVARGEHALPLSAPLGASAPPGPSASWDTQFGVDPVSAEQVISEGPPLWQLWTNPLIAWNPDAVLLAKRQADQGNLEYCSDLWESMLGDDRIAGALEQRILASEGMPLSFVGSPRGAKKLEALWAKLMTPGLRAEMFRWGMGPGICPVYVREWVDGEPQEVEIWHPRWLRYYWWERRWKIMSMSGLIDIRSQPGRWYLFCPFGQILSRPWVTGFWYSIATWWLTKAYAIPDMNNYGQTRATPKWFMGVIDGNATISKADRAQALTWLAKIPQRSSMFVPYPFKVDQHDSTSTGWQIYLAEIDKANASLAQRILGSDAGMDKSANVASGGTALVVRQDLIEYDCGAEQAFWRQGLLETWAQVNSIPGETPYPERITTPPEDLTTLAGVQKVAAETVEILTRSGFAEEVDVRATLGRFFVLRDPDTGEADETAPTDGAQLDLSDLSDLPETAVVRLSVSTGSVRVLKTGRTDFPQTGDDLKVSLRNSRFKIFDPDYADRLKEEWPEIWAMGGSTGEQNSGDSQYRKLRPVIARGGAPSTPTEERSIRTREAWAARHADNNRIAGVVALIKWFVVGSIGEARMKAVIQEEKDRRRERAGKTKNSLPLTRKRPHGSDPAQHAREGLGYRDTLVDVLQSAQAAAPTAEQVLRVLASARDYDDARARLTAAFPDLDRGRLRDLLTGGMLLADAAGRLTAGREAE